MLLLFILLGAAFSLLLCLHAGYTGLLLVGMLLLFSALGFLGVLLLYFLILWIVTSILDIDKSEAKNPGFLRFVLVESITLILQIGRVSVQAEGLSLLPEGTFLLACNHRSGFDPFVALHALKKWRLCFVSKASNFQIPIGGPLMRKCGFLAIDREDDRKALVTILDIAKRMQRGTASYGIYPEGTRSRTDELLPFRNGCFKAAQRARVPIVVATVENTELVKRNFFRRPTQTVFRICGVLDAETVCAAKTVDLGQQVRGMMLASLGHGESTAS